MKKLFSKLNSTLHVTRYTLRDSRGLTFIELIVVAAIFSILAAVSLFRFGGFTASVSLQNVSQDIALRLVQAQRDGSSGAYPRLRQDQVTILPIPWSPPTYGVHFDVAEEDKFHYFFDNMIGGVLNEYDSGTSYPECTGSDSECLEKITINSGDKIIGLCVEMGTILCPTDSVGNFVSTSVSKIDIVFKRPNLSAFIYPFDSGNNPITGNVTSAKISVQSKDGEHYKIITVYPVGQITVE